MSNNSIGFRRAFIINCTYFAIILAIVFVLARYVVPLLMPFILAFIVACLLQRPIRFMNRKLRLKKKLCGFIASMLFFIALGAFISWGGIELVTRIHGIVIDLPSFYSDTVAPMVINVFSKLETLEIWNELNLIELLRNLETQIMDALAGLATKISTTAISMVTGFAASLPMLFIKTILFVVSTVFISMDYDKLMGYVIHQMNDRVRELFDEIRVYMVGTLFVVIRSYLLIMSITFVELFVGLTLIGIDNAIIISLCIAVFDILPVLGTGGVMIPWSIVCLVMGNYGLGLQLFILYVIITIVRNIIEPKIVGKQLGLHPIVTLSSMFAGLQLLGGLGLFGFPITLSLLLHLNNKGVIKILKRD
ncbi:MAG: sporulation integral membrane protein YtvI [Anaerovoracaceae bacterium]|nr:sporulation integral membrane protein YtvI [Anaerovoracaceae bacterium]